MTGFWIGLPESKHERKKEKKVTGGPRVKLQKKKRKRNKQKARLDGLPFNVTIKEEED